jgi:hypothetical protein
MRLQFIDSKDEKLVCAAVERGLYNAALHWEHATSKPIPALSEPVEPNAVKDVAQHQRGVALVFALIEELVALHAEVKACEESLGRPTRRDFDTILWRLVGAMAAVDRVQARIAAVCSSAGRVLHLVFWGAWRACDWRAPHNMQRFVHVVCGVAAVTVTVMVPGLPALRPTATFAHAAAVGNALGRATSEAFSHVAAVVGCTEDCGDDSLRGLEEFCDQLRREAVRQCEASNRSVEQSRQDLARGVERIQSLVKSSIVGATIWPASEVLSAPFRVARLPEPPEESPFFWAGISSPTSFAADGLHVEALALSAIVDGVSEMLPGMRMLSRPQGGQKDRVEMRFLTAAEAKVWAGLADMLCAFLPAYLSSALGVNICGWLEVVGVSSDFLAAEHWASGETEPPSLGSLVYKGLSHAVASGQCRPDHLAHGKTLATAFGVWAKQAGANKLQALQHGAASAKAHWCRRQLARFQWLHAPFLQSEIASEEPALKALVGQLYKATQRLIHSHRTCREANDALARVEADVDARLRWVSGANPGIAPLAKAFSESAAHRQTASLSQLKDIGVAIGVGNALAHFETFRCSNSESMALENRNLELWALFCTLVGEAEQLERERVQTEAGLPAGLVELAPSNQVTLTWLQMRADALPMELASARRAFEAAAPALGSIQATFQELESCLSSGHSELGALMMEIQPLLGDLLKGKDAAAAVVEKTFSTWNSSLLDTLGGCQGLRNLLGSLNDADLNALERGAEWMAKLKPCLALRQLLESFSSSVVALQFAEQQDDGTDFSQDERSDGIFPEASAGTETTAHAFQLWDGVRRKLLGLVAQGSVAVPSDQQVRRRAAPSSSQPCGPLRFCYLFRSAR